MSKENKDKSFNDIMSYWDVKDKKAPINKSNNKITNSNNTIPPPQQTITTLKEEEQKQEQQQEITLPNIQPTNSYLDTEILTKTNIENFTSYKDSLVLASKDEDEHSVRQTFKSNHDEIYKNPDLDNTPRITTTTGLNSDSSYSDHGSFGDSNAYSDSNTYSSVSSYSGSQQSGGNSLYGNGESYQSSSEGGPYSIPSYKSGNDVYFGSSTPGLSSYSTPGGLDTAYIDDDNRSIDLLNVCSSSDFKEINSNWNEQFQRLLDLPESEDKYRHLSNMANDYVYCASSIGKIIISELHMPDDQKTIKPLNLGGVAGGLKFKCQDIIFKFVVDTELYPGLWMYGNSKRSDEFAQKSANHELKGLNHFMDLSDGLIRFPLMTIIDYRGYRLLAISSLPIGKDTIIYGSCDAGKTVHNKNPKIYEEMQRICKMLNLREHEVGMNQTKIYGPGDIEIHEGKDGRFYMIDFARCFPPEYPLTFKPKKDGSSKVGREIFYSMLRPEILRSSEVALSSDALSGWQTSENADEDYNQDVIKITEKLHNEIIPDIIKIIDSRIEASYVPSTEIQWDDQALKERHDLTENTGSGESVELESDKHPDAFFLNLNPNSFHSVEKDYTQKIYEIKKIINFIHSKGINLRYLGVIVRNIKNRLIKQIFLTEVVARVWKRIIRFKLRQIMDFTKRPSEEPYKRMISKVFHTILNNAKSENREFWSEVTPGNFKYLALSIFPRCLSETDISSMVDLRSIIDTRLLVVRIIQMLNIRINSAAYSQFLSDPQYIITARDIEEVGSTIKYPTIIDFAAGSVLVYETKKIICSTNYVPKEINRWIDSAQLKLSNALSSMPLSFKLILKLATTYLFRANVTNDFNEGIKLLNAAAVMINLASAHQRSHPLLIGLLGMAHLKLGTYYLFYTSNYRQYQKELDLARDRIVEALEKDPNAINDYIVQCFPITFTCGAWTQNGKFNHTRKLHETLSMVYILNSLPKDANIHKLMKPHFERIIQIENLTIPFTVSKLMNSAIITDLLERTTNMQQLVISKLSLTPASCLAITNMKNLTSFSINQVHFSTPKTPGGEGIENFAQFFKLLLTKCANLTTLKLFSRSIEDQTLEDCHPLFANLTNLSILDTYLSDQTLLALAPYLGNLTTLNISHTYDLSDKGISAIVEVAKDISHLELAYVHKLSNATGEVIIKNLQKIEQLNLTRCKMSSETLAEIVKISPLIQKLNLSDTNANQLVIEALESHGAEHLIELELKHAHSIENENYLEILSNLQPKLKVLHFPRTQIDTLYIWNLFKRLPDLVELKFPDHFHLPSFVQKFTDHNIREEYEQPLSNVKTLDLFLCTVSLKSLEFLMDMMPNLESLSLSAVQYVDENCYIKPIDDQVMMQLSLLFYNIKELNLSNLDIQKRNLSCLIKSMPGLTSLTLLNCKGISEQDKYDTGVLYPHIQFI